MLREQEPQIALPSRVPQRARSDVRSDPTMANHLEGLVETIKSKVRALKKTKKPYVKMDKSSSVKVEIRSRKARQLIDKTLKHADQPAKRGFF
ncbi:uncharacterized protein LOC120288416 [Eucalyptus grandis]|uniref:uncharacterized protein LOC120288416 n=1 Tax=Eucalyptus grandis TaxID=71139 RepID=UPI00192E8EDD|nr:uncharacterized protein LOC120288416 [Eucalyptus grandis]